MEATSLSNLSVTRAARRSQRLLILLAFVAFISLGLPDTILGVAWPFIRATFGKPLDALAFLLISGVSGYLTSSFFSGTIVRQIGVGRLLLASGLLVTIASTGNALAPAFGWMVGLSVLGGLGAGAIDAGLNAFAARHFSARVMNWMHAFYGVGATIGPAMMTALITANLGWRMGYGILACTLGVLSLLFLLTIRLWEEKEEATRADDPPHASIGEALSLPVVWMQAFLFFVYCGIESTAGQLMFSVLTESRGMKVSIAGGTIAGYWGALTIGRIVFGQVATFLSHAAVLRIGMGLSVFAAGLMVWNPLPVIGIIGTVLLGFGLAPIFPTLMSATPGRVGGRFSAQSVGFQVSAAAVGIATFPSLNGVVAQRFGLESVCVYLLCATILLLILNELVDVRAGRKRV